MLMEAEGLGFDELRRALDKLGGRRVHVVGDTIVDTSPTRTMIGGKTKTPTISVRFDSSDRLHRRRRDGRRAPARRPAPT